MRNLRRVGISLALALALYLTVIAGTDAHAVIAAAARLGWGWWGIILALSVVNYGLRFVRWHYYLHCLGHRLPAARHAIIYLAGFAMTTTPGKAGEAIRSLYLRDWNVGYGHSLATLFTERLVDLIAMLMLSVLGLLTFSDYSGWVFAALALFAVLLFVIQHPATARHVRNHAQRRDGGWIAAFSLRLVEPLNTSKALLRLRPLGIGVTLGLAGWAAEGIALYYILQQLGIQTDPALAVGIYAISILAGAISFMPGGLGSTEAVMVLLLTLTGAAPAAAVAATLITRIATLWFAVLIGLVALGGLELTRRREGPHINHS